MVEGDLGLLEGDLDLPVDAVGDGDGVGYCELGREEQRGRKTGGISLPLGRHKTEKKSQRIFMCCAWTKLFSPWPDYTGKMSKLSLLMRTTIGPTGMLPTDNSSCEPMESLEQGRGRSFQAVWCGKLGTNTQSLLDNTSDFILGDLHNKKLLSNKCFIQ